MEKELSIEFTRNPYIIRIRYDKKIIWKYYFENAIDFIHFLHILENKNDKEIYDYCKGTCYFADSIENEQEEN